MNKADEAARGDGTNISSDKAYGNMMAEECPGQDDIDDVSYEKYIGSEVIMDVPGECPRKVTFRRCVEDLNGAKA